MDMEQRKTNWRNRIYIITTNQLTSSQVSLIASICQDAFNEGHKAGYQERSDKTSIFTPEEPNDSQ